MTFMPERGIYEKSYMDLLHERMYKKSKKGRKKKGQRFWGEESYVSHPKKEEKL